LSRNFVLDTFGRYRYLKETEESPYHHSQYLTKEIGLFESLVIRFFSASVFSPYFKIGLGFSNRYYKSTGRKYWERNLQLKGIVGIGLDLILYDRIGIDIGLEHMPRHSRYWGVFDYILPRLEEDGSFARIGFYYYL